MGKAYRISGDEKYAKEWEMCIRDSSWAIEDASYLKLSNITLGYTFPKKVINKIGLTKLRPVSYTHL